MMSLKRIILSRTDSIGDVILTLPLAGILKKKMPEAEIYFLGRTYTRDVVETSKNVDYFIDWNEISKLTPEEQESRIETLKADVIIHVFPVKEIAFLAKKANIPLRIGATGRWYHYFACNKLVPLSRRNSGLHEAQLNLKLALPLTGTLEIDLYAIPDYYGFSKVLPLKEADQKRLNTTKFNLILHPKSKGSAREWGLENFARLIEILPKDKFEIFITGTKEEGELAKKDLLEKHSHIVDLTGQFSLKELIGFINGADGLVSASTGPLHIAAALGKHALGIYPPIRPMHPGRWAPLGKQADYFVADKTCSKCRKSNQCECMESISPELVKQKLLSLVSG
ncbi:MAG: glycosyltransferase family 9 protein [Bacteroidales bacterium]